jgi:hypothetical protein
VLSVDITPVDGGPTFNGLIFIMLAHPLYWGGEDLYGTEVRSVGFLASMISRFFDVSPDVITRAALTLSYRTPMSLEDIIEDLKNYDITFRTEFGSIIAPPEWSDVKILDNSNPHRLVLEGNVRPEGSDRVPLKGQTVFIMLSYPL